MFQIICGKSGTEKESETEETEHSYKDLLADPNYYLTLFGHIVFIIRRQTYVGWLGSGWPEWVAVGNDPVQFNQDINRLQSIVRSVLP